jgi:hypothetical protein
VKKLRAETWLLIRAAPPVKSILRDGIFRRVRRLARLKVDILSRSLKLDCCLLDVVNIGLGLAELLMSNVGIGRGRAKRGSR